MNLISEDKHDVEIHETEKAPKFQKNGLTETLEIYQKGSDGRESVNR